MEFKRICIIGLGLIGGSWALALKSRGIRTHRIGCDRPEVLKRALAAGAIDEGASDIASVVHGADLIILAAPVGTILNQLRQLKPHILSRALVTDTGSTKRMICEQAREALAGRALFIGGHPLAGKERSGFDCADGNLFENSRYVLTPLAPEDLKDERVLAFTALLNEIGAQPYMTDAATHDRAVAFLSHLPQLVSSALAAATEDKPGTTLPLEIAASGFRDLTRLAESPYDLWKDICRSNRDNIAAALDALIEKLETFKGRLDDPTLEREFRQAQKLRHRLEKTRLS
jgi:prephenate dehydrogenase